MAMDYQVSEEFKRRWSSRKFGAFTVVFFVATLFVWPAGLAVFSEWATFVQWLFGLYVIGNFSEHATDAYKNIKNGKSGS